MANISFLGTGAMGARMAKNLIKAGHSLTVWNRNSDKTRDLVADGAKLAANPKAAVAHADFVISMLTDDAASQHVWLNKEDGALSALPTGAIAIESSTISIEWAKQLAGEFRSAGAQLLEAPVSGTLPQVEASQLIYFIGGSTANFQKAEPILKVLGSTLHHVGNPGAAATIKLAVNTFMCVQYSALAEILGTFKKSDVDFKVAVDAMISTPLFGPAAKGAVALMVADKAPVLFPIKLAHKDLRYFDQASGGMETNAPLAHTAKAVLAMAIELGYGEDNITGVAKLY